MPPVRNSTERRHRTADKIKALGFLTMSPCPQCQKSGALCYVLKGCSRCSSCERKNVTCGGTFSDAEFDSLERKKQELRQQSQDTRSQLANLASQMLLMQKSLLATQRRQESIERQLERVTARQSEMVVQEAQLLEQLEDHATGDFGPDLAIMSGLDFSWDGLVAESLVLGDPGGIARGVQG